MKNRASLTRIITTCLLLFLPFQNASANLFQEPKSLFVSPQLNSGADCSRESPCSLYDAIQIASSGDAIYFASGKYRHDSRSTHSEVIYLDKSISLLGGWNGEFEGPVQRDTTKFPSTLDGEGVRRVMAIQGADSGSEINPTIDGLIFSSINNLDPGTTDCSTESGAADGCGIYAENSNSTIDHNVFRGFQADSVIKLVNSSGTIDGNLFIDNLPPSDVSSMMLIAIQSTSTIQNLPLWIQNNILIGEPGSEDDIMGINLDAGSAGQLSVEVVYNTLVGLSSAVELQNSAAAKVRYNIFASNMTGVSDPFFAGLEGDYNLFFNNISDISPANPLFTNSVSGDPKFIDPAGNNYHIAIDSAASSQGICLVEVSDDIDSQPRPFPGNCDLGADQFLHQIYLPAIHG